MRETHSSNAYSRASLYSDCPKVDAGVFAVIGPVMKSLLKRVDENVRIKLVHLLYH